MNDVLITNARVLTLSPIEHDDLGTLESADVFIQNGKIVSVGKNANPGQAQPHDAGGRVLMPAFVDCHTHACWAGCRLAEWEQKLKGASYLELLAAGGGIMSTVRAVREASPDELRDSLLCRLERMQGTGTLTAEVKSGYGLSTRDEIKMLEAISEANNTWLGTAIPTACIGHAKDPDYENFVDDTIIETLPEISRCFPGITIDAYCEEGSWTLEETLRLFDAAQTAGHPIRVHADQFNDLGMIPEAVSRGFRSVDHLEATTADHLTMLAKSDSFGVMLPICGLHLDNRFGDGRAFLDAGGKLAIASNYNPGSAPSHAMPMVIAAAVRHLGLLPSEAIAASTRTPAELLGLNDRGSVQAGRRADLILLDMTDERELAFEFGANPVRAAWAAGRRVV